MRDRFVRRPRRPRRRTVLTVLALVVAVPIVVVLEAVWAITRPRLPADPGFEVSMLVGEQQPGAPLTMHVLGDSTVAGVGVTRSRDAMPVQIAQRVSDELRRPVQLVGHGVSGAVTSDVLDQLEDVPSEGVDVLVIEIGSNDVTHRTRLDDVSSGTRRMLEQATERSPVVVFGSSGKLNTPNFLQPLRWIIMQRATAVRARQERVARTFDVEFVNVAEEVAPEFERIGPSSNSSDGFHPSRRATPHGRGPSPIAWCRQSGRTVQKPPVPEAPMRTCTRCDRIASQPACCVQIQLQPVVYGYT